MAANPSKRPSSSITLHYDVSSALLAEGIVPAMAAPKKLRRMPHLFCRVLELPLHSDSPVVVRETHDCFTFAVAVSLNLVSQYVFAEVVEVVPGVTKVCIAGAHRLRTVLDELDIPPWRFRLPACCVSEASTASYDNGTLIVTVPKTTSSNINEEADLEIDSHETDQKEDGAKTGMVRTPLDLEKYQNGTAQQEDSRHAITGPRPVDVGEGQHRLDQEEGVHCCNSFKFVNFKKVGADLRGEYARKCWWNHLASPASILNASSFLARIIGSTSSDNQWDKLKKNPMKCRSNHFACHSSLYNPNRSARETDNSIVRDAGDKVGLKAFFLETCNLAFAIQRDLLYQPLLLFSHIQSLVWSFVYLQ